MIIVINNCAREPRAFCSWTIYIYYTLLGKRNACCLTKFRRKTNYVIRYTRACIILRMVYTIIYDLLDEFRPCPPSSRPRVPFESRLFFLLFSSFFTIHATHTFTYILMFFPWRLEPRKSRTTIFRRSCVRHKLRASLGFRRISNSRVTV